MAQLSSSGEVGQFLSVSQFDGGSTGKCGFYACATVAGSAAPGGQTWSASAIIASAHTNFVQFDGADVTNNLIGMTQDKCHSDLATYGLTGQDISPDWPTIKTSLAQGYPVIICVPEAQVVDVQVGGLPYPWLPGGMAHIILLTGLASDGNVLVRDSANITPPNNVRPGPRVYTTGMQPYWAVAVTPAWFTSQQGGPSMSGVPQGWKDANGVLTAPNGVQVTQGFRDYVLSHSWDAANLPLSPAQGLNPLELSNTALGGGTRQTFRWTCLEWTSKHGVFESWVGQELVTVLALLSKTQGDLQQLRDAWNAVVPEKNGLVDQVAQLKTQLAQANAELAQFKAQPAGNVEQLQQQVDTLTKQAQAATAQVSLFSNKLMQINTISKIGA